MSLLPPDPLAHIDDSEIPESSIKAVENHIHNKCLHKSFTEKDEAVFFTGHHLVLHVALRLSQEAHIHARDFLHSINDGRRPFADIYLYLAKLGYHMGAKLMGKRFVTLYKEMRADCEKGFAVSPYMARSDKTEVPLKLIESPKQRTPVTFAPSSREQDSTLEERFSKVEESLSIRVASYRSPSRFVTTNADRDTFWSTDKDMISEICRSDEDITMLHTLPLYCCLGSDRKGLVSALRAIVRLGRKRKEEGIDEFIKVIKDHTMFSLQARNSVPHILVASSFLASVRSDNPHVFVLALEIAAYILKQGIRNLEELSMTITARAVNSPDDSHDVFIANGWAVHPGAYMCVKAPRRRIRRNPQIKVPVSRIKGPVMRPPVTRTKGVGFRL